MFVVQRPESDQQDAKPKVERVTVKVAERRGNVARIKAGVEPGDEVVTTGQLRLSDGSFVDVKEKDTMQPPEQIPAL